jgi:non-ribosomal peptide synthetase component E (peptide arylation enzyme)
MSSTYLSQTRVNSSECRHLPPRSETISALDHLFNSCRFPVALFGLLRAGAIPVMCLPGHRLAELSHFADVSRAVALIIPDIAGGFDYRADGR